MNIQDISTEIKVKKSEIMPRLPEEAGQDWDHVKNGKPVELVECKFDETGNLSEFDERYESIQESLRDTSHRDDLITDMLQLLRSRSTDDLRKDFVPQSYIATIIEYELNYLMSSIESGGFERIKKLEQDIYEVAPHLDLLPGKTFPNIPKDLFKEVHELSSIFINQGFFVRGERKFSADGEGNYFVDGKKITLKDGMKVYDDDVERFCSAEREINKLLANSGIDYSAKSFFDMPEIIDFRQQVYFIREAIDQEDERKALKFWKDIEDFCTALAFHNQKKVPDSSFLEKVENLRDGVVLWKAGLSLLIDESIHYSLLYKALDNPYTFEYFLKNFLPEAITASTDETALQKRVKEILDAEQACGDFDTSKLPAILNDHIQSKCQETNADPITITQSVVCTLSAVIGKRAFISEQHYFQRLYPVIWALTISKSGSFKTTALNKLGYKALLTNLFDVPALYDYKTKTGGMLLIRRPFITINAVSTLAWVQKNITAEDVSSGFFPRFLLFYPPPKEIIPPALPEFSPNQKVSIDLKTIIDSLRSPRAFQLSAHGQDVFKAMHKQLYVELHKLPEKSQEIIAPYVKRWSPYILKIAMLLELIADPNSDQINAESILGASSIVEYAIKSTTFLFQNDLGESIQQRKQRIVLEYIAKKKGRVERAQLLSSRVLDGGAPEYDNVLNNLEGTGQILVSKNGNQSKWTYSLTINN